MRRILGNLSPVIDPDERVGIVSESGSGKSTLSRILADASQWCGLADLLT
ncbi:ATP-binding cassette domain-containing protein [Microtetraspora sp. NBRC 16547]|nr:ATP-binding cassette domain-containing protein [Microtetraspora sp. NBRC 16547]